jgi:hypothetical protein
MRAPQARHGPFTRRCAAIGFFLTDGVRQGPLASAGRCWSIWLRHVTGFSHARIGKASKST